MYNIYNKETGELLEKQITEQKLIDFANEEFAETDNIEDAIENDLTKKGEIINDRSTQT